MYDDIMCPLAARNQLGDAISNREIYAAVRKILDSEGTPVSRIEACTDLVAVLGKTFPTDFIAKSKATIAKFIETASQWLTFDDLCRLQSIDDSLLNKACKGRHEQIADILLQQSFKSVDVNWVKVAKILIDSDETNLIDCIVAHMPMPAAEYLIKDATFFVPAEIYKPCVKRYLLLNYNIELQEENAYIGPHPTISLYYPQYKKGEHQDTIKIQSGSYSSGKHDHTITSNVVMQPEENTLRIEFAADIYSKGYRYNTSKNLTFVVDLDKKTMYKKTKKGLLKISD